MPDPSDPSDPTDPADRAPGTGTEPTPGALLAETQRLQRAAARLDWRILRRLWWGHIRPPRP